MQDAKRLRVCFAGTPSFAATHLNALLRSPHNVCGVYTQPDRPAGRGKKILSSPVKQLALLHNIPVLQPESLKGELAAATLANFNADVLVVVAYGLILPQSILDVPKYGCINVHASLLPRWRGAAPIERAILAGDKESGVTIIQMDAGLDTGSMLYSNAVAINPQDNRQDLEAKLEEAGPKALLHVLATLPDARENARSQDDSMASYAYKLDKAEALIDWNSPAEEVNRKVRAGVGRMPAYSMLDGSRLRVLEAQASLIKDSVPGGTIIDCSRDNFLVACKDSSLFVSSVQLPGKTATAVRDVMNSRPELFTVGKVFTSEATGA
ncbi:MAG: methionyl-tRNA formyltransferase [Gammaproteobacteria bacterium]